MTGRLLTARELADLLGMQTWTVLQWTRDEKLPGFKLPSGQLRFRQDEIERWLESRRVGQVEERGLRAVREEN